MRILYTLLAALIVFNVNVALGICKIWAVAGLCCGVNPRKETERCRGTVLAHVCQALNFGNSLGGLIVAGDFTASAEKRQLDSFIQWVDPFSKLQVPILVGHGERDTIGQRVGSFTPSIDYVQKQYGRVHYVYNSDALGNLYIICCGKYPGDYNTNIYWDPGTLHWLANVLGNLGEKTPIIIFFHYNLVGPLSECWNQKYKDEFYNLIKEHNIKCIITGHCPIAYTYLWREKKIPTVSVGPNFFAELVWTPKSEDLLVGLYDVTGKNYEWNELSLQGLVETRRLRAVTKHRCLRAKSRKTFLPKLP